VSEEIVPRDELHATIEARKEVDEDMEPAMIEAFVERIEHRLEQRADRSERALKRKRDHQREMVLGSLAISIPLFAMAAIFTGLAGIIAVCVVLGVIAIASMRS